MKSDIKIVIVILGIIAFVSILVVSQLGRPSPEIASPPATTEEESPTEYELAPIVVQNWELSNVSYKITEKNEIWWKFSWQVTVENNTSHIMDFYVTINFVDRQGYIIDDDIENPPVFGPKERRVIKGYALIDADIAPDVREAEPEMSYAFIQD